MIFAVMQQYMIPSVKNSLIPFSNMDVTKATERLLKLAVLIYCKLFIYFIIVVFLDSQPFSMAVYVLYYVPLFSKLDWRVTAIC